MSKNNIKHNNVANCEKRWYSMRSRYTNIWKNDSAEDEKKGAVR